MPPPAQLKHFILPISHRGESREGCEDTTKEWASLLVSLSIFTQHASILARQVEMGTETQSTPPPNRIPGSAPGRCRQQLSNCDAIMEQRGNRDEIESVMLKLAYKGLGYSQPCNFSLAPCLLAKIWGQLEP